MQSCKIKGINILKIQSRDHVALRMFSQQFSQRKCNVMKYNPIYDIAISSKEAKIKCNKIEIKLVFI